MWCHLCRQVHTQAPVQVPQLCVACGYEREAAWMLDVYRYHNRMAGVNAPLDDNDWVQDPNGKTESHWLALATEPAGDGLHWWTVSVKWDGCFDLHRAHNVPFGTPDRDKDRMAFSSDLHGCDLDDLIEKLTKLRDAAKKHFGEGWPG